MTVENEQQVTYVNSEEEIIPPKAPEIKTPAEPELPVSKEQEAPTDEPPAEELNEEKDGDKEKSDDDLPLPVPEAGKKQMPEYFKNRLSKEQRKLQQAENELRILQEQLARMQQPPTAAINQNSQPGFTPNNEAPPKRESFANDEDFIDARIEYKKRADNFSQQAQTQQQAMMQAELSFHNKMKDALNVGTESYDDFDDVVKPLFSAGFPGNRAMAEAIVDSPYKHDMLYFLGKYTDKAREIALSHPVQAIKKIAELEVRFKARDKKVVKSKSPEPPEPVKTNSAKNEGDLNTLAENGSQAAFDAALDKYSKSKPNPW